MKRLLTLTEQQSKFLALWYAINCKAAHAAATVDKGAYQLIIEVEREKEAHG